MTAPDAPDAVPPPAFPLKMDGASVRFLRAAVDAQRRQYGVGLASLRAAILGAGESAKAPDVAEDLRALVRELHELAGKWA